METVHNITTATSQAIWGKAGETVHDETVHNETAGREPVSGQMGNVNAGEPYDKGNMEPQSQIIEEQTSKSGMPDGTGATGTRDTTGTSAQHGRPATGATSSLYNPILPANPGETGAADYTTSARRVSSQGADSQVSPRTSPNVLAQSPDSREGEPLSPTWQDVPESLKKSDSVTPEKGYAPKSSITIEENKGAQKGRDYSLPPISAVPTAQTGRRRSSASSQSISRDQLAYHSISREVDRKTAERNALAPLHVTESQRRRTAQLAFEGDDEAGAVGSSFSKARKPSLKEKFLGKIGKR